MRFFLGFFKILASYLRPFENFFEIPGVLVIFLPFFEILARFSWDSLGILLGFSWDSLGILVIFLESFEILLGFFRDSCDIS